MSKNKLFVIISIVLIVALCFTIFVRPKKSDNFDLTNTIELLDSLTDEINELLPEYLIKTRGSNTVWVTEFDSFNILLNQYPFNIKEFVHFCENEITCFSSSEKKKIYKILENTDKSNQQECTFVKKQIKYLYAINLYKQMTYNMFMFTDMSVRAYSKKDTINLGEEYIAEIPYIGAIFNYKPTLVLDGDTVETAELENIFRERPTKRGLIRHEGYMTMYCLDGEIEIPFKIEYYVK
jgi:hypothetical protein